MINVELVFLNKTKKQYLVKYDNGLPPGLIVSSFNEIDNTTNTHVFILKNKHELIYKEI